ncbi:inositol monophosphatase [Frigoribacterium sp. CFBP 13729]|uniref:inositol monophosphatase family protein n=1 Tax=unclassified Frigoribacterium TaxID=2627005 RepID=UPI00177C6FA3|nr:MULTISPECIES: inositol monophosphatase family protein [unclassified Frigoribacterium]MBD8585101.1 inositol monophosphatase [Frigoribacterium sp. CFBP 8766]MBD8609866.1 inositol monophosphatase [Frigoribacterium sp. CFBP 13729]
MDDTSTSPQDAAALLAVAVDVTTAAARLAAARRAEGVEVADTKSSLVDVVTHTDREVESFLRARLAELRPGDGFLGEEGDPDDSSTGLTWVVDPIDGTVNFLYGIPQWAVSVAVVEGGPDPLTWSALAACVVNPLSGEVFTASRGGGAWLGEERLVPSAPASLAESLFATGFSYEADRRVEQAAVVGRLIGQVRDLRRLGAASLDLCAVAAGRLDVYAERGLKPWDHAAGVLVAQEAGAVVRGEEGQAPSGRLVVASARSVARAVDGLLEDARF